MNVNGLDRALRYFVRQAELYVFYSFAGSFAMVIYIWMLRFTGEDSETLRDSMQSVPFMFLTVSLLIIVTVGMTSMQQLDSMLISFGCSRKNLFVANLVMNLLYISQVIVIYEIMTAVWTQDTNALKAPLLLSVYLSMEGISQLAGAAGVKWGKVLYVILFAGIVVVSISAGIFVGLSGENFEIGIFRLAYSRQWLLMFLGVVVCIVTNTVSYCFFRYYEVRV